MLEVRCPGCAKLLQVVETATDRDSVCPACGILFRPDAVWLGSAIPANAIDSTIDQSSAEDVSWQTRPDPAIVGAMPQQEISLWRCAKLGFAAGGLVVLFNSVTSGLDANNPVDFVMITALICGSCAIFGIVYGLVLHAAPDDWHRVSFRIGTVGAVCVFVALRLTQLLLARRSAGLAFVQACVWISALFGLGSYLFLSMLRRITSRLAQVGNGLRKAAGRPTQSRNAEPRSTVDMLDDEDPWT